MDDPVVSARAVIREVAPTARWAVLAGSVLTDARTSGSDLDMVVCLPEHPGLPYRRSLHRGGWPVELFVHDETTLRHYLAKGQAERRPVLCRMIATGRVIVGDAAGVRDRCTAALAAGPGPLGGRELDRLRYELTDLVHDLIHSRDQGETVIIAATVWMRAAELALHAGGHWLGSGKWLLRELRDLDERLADRWLAAAEDPSAVAEFARDVLDGAGGPLFDGYHDPGERPSDEQPADEQPAG